MSLSLVSVSDLSLVSHLASILKPEDKRDRDTEYETIGEAIFFVDGVTEGGGHDHHYEVKYESHVGGNESFVSLEIGEL